MGRYSTWPTLYDDVQQITITKLKEWGYLKENQKISAELSWSSGGRTTACISIIVSINDFNPYMKLSYNYGGEPREYKIPLIQTPSNLGKGKIWFFVCPQTKKRCRKLYLISGYFFHREAFSGALYQSQTKSKSYRVMEKAFKRVFL